MPRVERFPGDQYPQAAQAALDPKVDLVLIDKFVDTCQGSFLNWQAEAIAKLHSLTPAINQWWRMHQIDSLGEELLERNRPLLVPEKPMHIDLAPFIGFVASVNLCQARTPRMIYASRKDVPSFVTNDGLLDNAARLEFRRSIADFEPPEEQWEIINTGDAALFGALPNLAKHATRGTTNQGLLMTWTTDSAAASAGELYLGS